MLLGSEFPSPEGYSVLSSFPVFDTGGESRAHSPERAARLRFLRGPPCHQHSACGSPLRSAKMGFPFPEGPKTFWTVSSSSAPDSTESLRNTCHRHQAAWCWTWRSPRVLARARFRSQDPLSSYRMDITGSLSKSRSFSHFDLSELEVRRFTFISSEAPGSDISSSNPLCRPDTHACFPAARQEIAALPAHAEYGPGIPLSS